MTEWIYESPDGGNTIVRRALGRHEGDHVGKFLMVDDQWWPIQNVKELIRSSYRQQCLRHEHPALKQLWDEYHVMLKLVDDKHG
jgi:hypothetical protein